MKELQSGVTYDGHDMADWFGIGYNGFRYNKTRKLEILRDYAEFELLPNGRIHITKVLRPVYVKRTKKETEWFYNAIAHIILANPYQTSAHLALQLQKKFPEKFAERPLAGIVSEVRLCLEEMFGETGEYGSVGVHIWCQYSDEEGLSPIAQNQHRVLQNIIIDEFSKAGLDLAMIQSQFNFKEIGNLADLENIIKLRYDRVVERFKEKFGFTPVTATRYELNTIISKKGKRKIRKIKKETS